jgi:CBS domain-containing protein/gamma-glutamyl:cysteine ligase YbdK (ATP-grasp superfamily)
MGTLLVDPVAGPEAVRTFTEAVLRDLHALRAMLEEDRFETGIHRLGAEQECFLVDHRGAPAPIALELLRRLDNPSFTTEIGLFNLEVNLPAIRTGPDLLEHLSAALRAAVDTVRHGARSLGADVVLTGILPTLGRGDLQLENLTPRDRYRALNDAVMHAVGRVRLRIEGVDELLMEHDSVMLEACTTSFQVHLQVDPQSFARCYNAAQAVLGPVLAVAANSPMALGRRLWAETRIALFDQSLDTRVATPYPRDQLSRVWFGDGWVRDSVLELFSQNIARYRPLVTNGGIENPFEALACGRIPSLQALQVHNTTVYRWNRPCYGVTNGKPHLRIECRALPSGPTISDEVANAAFWAGLVLGGADHLEDLPARLDFAAAKANFIAAARSGLETGFNWLDGERLTATELIRDRLLPLAQLGLRGAGVRDADIDRNLTIIERRTLSGRTGAQWLVRSDQQLRSRVTRAERLTALTAAMVGRADGDTPVHEWTPAGVADLEQMHVRFERVEDCMTTDLLTVHEDDALDLVAFLIGNRRVRQIPVEDATHRLTGMLSYHALLGVVDSGRAHHGRRSQAVRDIMDRGCISVSHAAPLTDAIRLMREHGVTALPVLDDGCLVGILSEHDLLPVLARLLGTDPIPRSVVCETNGRRSR